MGNVFYLSDYINDDVYKLTQSGEIPICFNNFT